MPVTVRNTDIDVTVENVVRVHNSSLATALVQSKESGDDSDIVNLLKFADKGFSLNKVRISSSGAVVIDSPALYSHFKRSFEAATPKQLLADNGMCGANCPDK